MPELEEVDNSDDEPVSESDDEDTSPRGPAAAKPKITAYWKVETAAEKAVRMEREAREYSGRAEEQRLREMEATRMKAAQKRAYATERMQRFRIRERDEKMANGWIPGQKRKRVDLVDVDETGASTGITRGYTRCGSATHIRCDTQL
ncbi:hypothetical protein B0H10DRAFT_2237539 [Mycena sp. CBHHK59/15]|nr:hypothetical protein B0H10DRAFT_2237539 [Mycena sp. CBHHK59/15]